MLSFFLTFSKKELIIMLYILLVSVYPLCKLGTFPPLASVMSQDLALQQGESQLQTASAELLDVFNKHIISLEDILSLCNRINFMVPVTSLKC
jgi:hypothetical protein